MKKLYCFIAAMFFLFGVSAQQTDTPKTKPSQTVVIRDLPDPPKKLKFLSIVDGKQHYGRHIKRVNPKYIINVDVLKQDSAVSKYGQLGINGAVIITTKQYAVKVYKKKLSDFSETYRTYMQENHDDDKGVAYTINGDAFEGDPIAMIMKLYKVPTEKIRALLITKNPNFNGFGNKAVVAITTDNK